MTSRDRVRIFYLELQRQRINDSMPRNLYRDFDGLKPLYIRIIADTHFALLEQVAFITLGEFITKPFRYLIIILPSW